MRLLQNRYIRKGLPLVVSLFLALVAISVVLIAAQIGAVRIAAAPIPPPDGYPKLTQSMKVVSPTLAATGGSTLVYQIEIRNTGAYMAEGVTLTDPIPQEVTYNGDGWASTGTPLYSGGILSWNGTVGFDTTVLITFSAQVSDTYSGLIQNTAVISQAQIAHPVTVTAETMVTDDPIFKVAKTSTPAKPGANKPLTYALEVTNVGQPAANTPVTVTDVVPANTTFSEAGPDGMHQGNLVTWTRPVTLSTGESSVFTFTVMVNSVPSGTVVTNANYTVAGPDGIPAPGEVYTVTVIKPILSLAKYVQPDPPGSNREMTYYITVLNKGSLATDVVIQDVVPISVTYVTGGSYNGTTVTWNLPELDTNQSEVVSYTVSIGDIAEIPLVNSDYDICSAEDVCQAGRVLTSTVGGPTFQLDGWLDPIAKKPGGGTGTEVTPTLTVENLGPGNALGATATLRFERISVQGSDLIAIPAVGAFSPAYKCGDKCVLFTWTGDIAHGDTITFTTSEGQNSIGGAEGTHYTATIAITDALGAYITPVITDVVTGTVTHNANLIPTKSAPPVVGNGQLLTYKINILDTGLTTDVPPYPVVTDTVPASTTLVSISDGGVSTTVGSTTVVSWTLDSMGPGDLYQRSFTVRVWHDLISGTQIVNQDYGTAWYNDYAGGMLSNTGVPVTTTVKELGLIDSFKTVTPTLARPGEGNILTYTVHVVNSSPSPLSGVRVDDLLPWQDSTYLRNAVASSGQIISDIVSLSWVGDVGPLSTELITFSVEVDKDFEGTITNTATITHTSLRAPVIAQAVAYITNKPVLKISKKATPSPVTVNGELLYTIQVDNLGQQATELVITDTIPGNGTYVPGSASAGGQLVGNTVQWQIPVLKPGDRFTFTFRVTVNAGEYIVNDRYGVTCAEGVSAKGAPVITPIRRYYFPVYLPVLSRQP